MNNSSRNPEDCCPELRDKIQPIMADLARELTTGDTAIISQTYRNEADQLACWNCGRNAEGNITNPAEVKTYKKPGTSEHGKLDAMMRPASRAIDILILRHGRVVDSSLDPSYAIVHAVMIRHGLHTLKFEAAHGELPPNKDK